MSHTLGDSLRQKAGKALQTAAGLSAVFVARNLSPSVASLAQRLAGCGRTTDTLPSGSPLLVSLAGVAEHSGIYVGDGMVAERSGDGKLRVVTLSEFLNGCEGDGLKVRGGLRIYAWCDLDSGRVLADLAVGEAARKFVADEASTGYHLLRENCHMFSASCVAGELLQRMSVSDELQDGAFTVDKLEAVIANRLNADKPIGYIQLSSPVDGFSFAPAEEKVALCNQLADKAMSAYEKLKGFGPLPNMAPGAKQNVKEFRK